MFVAEIPGGLRTWGSHSQCVHAVSPNVSGPYVRQNVVMGPECHNPATLRHPTTGKYLLFHIGSGPKSEHHAGGQGFMMHSATPNGPWTAATTAPKSCNNPAPAVRSFATSPGFTLAVTPRPSPQYHPNGTLFAICNHMDITVAREDWEGSWSDLRSIGHPSAQSRAGNWEECDGHCLHNFPNFSCLFTQHILYVQSVPVVRQARQFSCGLSRLLPGSLQCPQRVQCWARVFRRWLDMALWRRRTLLWPCMRSICTCSEGASCEMQCSVTWHI
eukprot:SAG31_NODE_663_length_13021_cov_9.408296_2_plen_273_part_00